MESMPALDFIVVDDDSVNNMICKKMIEFAYPGSSVRTFLIPGEALAHITEVYSAPDANTAVLFLDLDMPDPTGWEVLDKLVTFDISIMQRLKIYILTSSVNRNDEEHANTFSIVSGFFSKPLTQEILKNIVDPS